VAKLFKLFGKDTPVKKEWHGHAYGYTMTGDEDRFCVRLETPPDQDDEFTGYALKLSYSEAKKLAKTLAKYLADESASRPSLIPGDEEKEIAQSYSSQSSK